MEKVRNPPRFSRLLRSARSFGNYDLSAAIADLIDNSIFSEADKINIHCKFLGGKPEIRIRDNGCGMSKAQLIVAMRTPNRNPEDDREAGDLGRLLVKHLTEDRFTQVLTVVLFATALSLFFTSIPRLVN